MQLGALIYQKQSQHSKLNSLLWSEIVNELRTKQQTCTMIAAMLSRWHDLECSVIREGFYVVRKTHKAWETRLRIIRLVQMPKKNGHYLNTWTCQIRFTRARRESIHWGSSPTTCLSSVSTQFWGCPLLKPNPDKTVKKLLLQAREVASEGEKQMREKKGGFLNPTSQICFGPNKRLIVSVGVQLPLLQQCTPWPIGFLKKWFCGENSIFELPSLHCLTEHMSMHCLPEIQSRKLFNTFRYHLALLKETFEVWQLDFVPMPPSQWCKCILVIFPTG